MWRFAKTHSEMFWSILGGATGGITGFFVGGLGLAAGGRATGAPTLVVIIIFAIVVGLAGNRLGIAIGRRQSR